MTFSQEQIEALKAEARLHPHMRLGSFVQKLERRKRREEREQAKEAEKPSWSPFNWLMGKQS